MARTLLILQLQKGVGQGSVLGFILFTLSGNDLPKVCPNCAIKQFADDTKASK